MLKTNKKLSKSNGFTLVELVIVIAIIAVLAAVLVPTFSSLIRKANISSDTVLAKNLNTAISLYKAETGKTDLTFDDSIKAVKERGYVLANLNAKAKDCYFVWEDQTDQFLLIEKIKEEPRYNVLFNIADGYYTYDKTKGEENEYWCFGVSAAEVITELEKIYVGARFMSIATSTQGLLDFIEQATDKTQTIYVDDTMDFTPLEDGEFLWVPNLNTNLTLVLGESEISRINNNKRLLVNEGNLVVEGGIFNGGQEKYHQDLMLGIENYYGNISFTDTKIINNNMGILSTFGSLKIQECEIETNIAPSSGSNYNAALMIQGCNDVTINDTVIKSGGNGVFASCTSISIDGGNYHSDKILFYLTVQSNYTTSLTINDGDFSSGGVMFNFTHNTSATNRCVEVILYGGTFNNISFNEIRDYFKQFDDAQIQDIDSKYKNLFDKDYPIMVNVLEDGGIRFYWKVK